MNAGVGDRAGRVVRVAADQQVRAPGRRRRRPRRGRAGSRARRAAAARSPPAPASRRTAAVDGVARVGDERDVAGIELCQAEVREPLLGAEQRHAPRARGRAPRRSGARSSRRRPRAARAGRGSSGRRARPAARASRREHVAQLGRRRHVGVADAERDHVDAAPRAPRRRVRMSSRREVLGKRRRAGARSARQPAASSGATSDGSSSASYRRSAVPDQLDRELGRSTSTSTCRPASRRRPGSSQRPSTMAATAEATAPEPQACVSPTPRSQTRSARRWRIEHVDRLDVRALGEPRVMLEPRALVLERDRPRGRRRRARSAGCRSRRSGGRGPGASPIGRVLRAARASPCPSCTAMRPSSRIARVAGPGVGPDRELAASRAAAAARRPRCGCRCPETSAIEPSRFHTRTATSASSGCQTSSTPSAPRPVAASQRMPRARRRDRAAGASRSTSRKWLPSACHFARRIGREGTRAISRSGPLEERERARRDARRPPRRRPTRRAGGPGTARPARS